jgi:hypothetical protein
MNYELRDLGVTHPSLGLPVPPYIVVARVTTVFYRHKTKATVQSGQGDEGCHL